ncbi:MAG: hypothetical protein ACI4EQ_10195 [Lachnospiraceae bacterium]
MHPMSKFEKKFGKYAIPNLATVLLICYAAGYIIQLINSDFMAYMTLNPYAVLHGQVWRLVTWIIVPPASGNIFVTLIMLYFYWSLGIALERMWGTYRFNVYIFSGILLTIIGSFAAMGLVYLFYGEAWGLSDPVIASLVFRAGSLFFSTEYINLAIFLAMAATLPDMQVLLMFIVPVKMKWMGIVYAIIAVWEFFSPAQVIAGGVLVLDCSIFNRAAILSSLLNFIIFFLMNKTRLRSPKQVKRQMVYKREVQRSTQANAHHKCAICGRTDESHPELEFRYCSKCMGNYEYCQDHLFTHTHIQ